MVRCRSTRSSAARPRSARGLRARLRRRESVRLFSQPKPDRENRERVPYLLGYFSAGGGHRTHTPLAGPRILSPVRLPVPPPRHREHLVSAFRAFAENASRVPSPAGSLEVSDAGAPEIMRNPARQVCRGARVLRGAGVEPDCSGFQLHLSPLQFQHFALNPPPIVDRRIL